MSESLNIELDLKFLSELYKLNNSNLPEIDSITLDMLKEQVSAVGTYIEKIKSGEIEENAEESSDKSKENLQPDQEGAPTNYNLPLLQFIDPSKIKRERKQYYDDSGHPVKGKVLIIDDLGTITYQLSVIFKRAGYLPITSKEIYDAIEKFKRSSYDYVIMDLFIPTEREGFILFEEIKKIAHARNDVPIISVMSASTRKEHKQSCEQRGAAFYAEKTGDWQRELFKALLQY